MDNSSIDARFSARALACTPEDFDERLADLRSRIEHHAEPIEDRIFELRGRVRDLISRVDQILADHNAAVHGSQSATRPGDPRHCHHTPPAQLV